MPDAIPFQTAEAEVVILLLLAVAFIAASLLAYATCFNRSPEKKQDHREQHRRRAA